jgi:hypothetical protein
MTESEKRHSNLRTPTTDEIVGRLLLTSFPVATFACLGLGLQATNLFNAYVTVLVITATTFLQAMLRGTRLTPATGFEASLHDRFGPLRDAVESIPMLKKDTLATSSQFGAAVLFGIFVAVLERIIGVGMFSWAGHPADTLLSLFIVLFAAYFIAETIRGAHLYESSEWMGRIEDGVRHAVGIKAHDLTVRSRTGAYALLRATFGTMIRALALLVLPTVFGSGWMLAGLVLGVLGIIAGFETIQFLLKAAMSAAKPARPSEAG